MLLSQIITAAVFLFVAMLSSALAQTARERERDLNEQEIELRSWNLKILSLNANKPAKARVRPEQALAQLQEDFTRLQVVNKNLVLSISEKRPLDFKFVSTSVSEIRKRSERLNENLALPQAEAPAAAPSQTIVTNSMQLKLSLLRLGNLIYSFTNNPFFKQPSVLDPEQSVKARRELLEIVELSARIKKDSERLKKSGT